ncbi:tetratricopeptide repeat protein [Aquihabitans sp. McL0605]|uniref:tetratricopeptide repeat protein n=1 Tax=Aquihabitans sp. McL0605 TaxID=3415671 RepID=UPI003CF47D64
MTSSAVSRASMLVAVGRCRDAVTLLRSVGDDTANSATACSVLAQAHLGLDEPKEALEAADAALEMAPLHIDALRFRARALSQLHRHSAALESARTAVRCYPHSALALITLANCELDGGRPLDAEATAAAAIEMQPADAGTHALAGRVALELGQLDEAAAHLHRALAIDPERADALNNLGIVELRRGEYAAAEERFLGAVRLTGSETMASNLLRARKAEQFQRGQWWRTPVLFVVFAGCAFVTLAFNNPWPGIVISGLVVGGLRISVNDPEGDWPTRVRATGRLAARTLPALLVALAVAGLIDGPLWLTALAVPLAIAAFLAGQALRQRAAPLPHIPRAPIATAKEAALVVSGGAGLWAVAARGNGYLLVALVAVIFGARIVTLARTGQLRFRERVRRPLRAMAILMIAYAALIIAASVADHDPGPGIVAAVVLVGAFAAQRYLRRPTAPGTTPTA